MSRYSRRAFTLAGLSAAALAACGNGFGGGGAETIDARVQRVLADMYARYPNTRQLADRSSGMLVMPLVTEAGMGIGGGYGRGSLLVDGVPVDYYSATKANVGLQIGAQQYSHVLFFMTDNALMNFRRGPGWAAGGDIEYATPEQGETLRAETTTSLSPVIAVIFGVSGLRIGATLEGTKYTRIIPG